jgi:hypothetical protein
LTESGEGFLKLETICVIPTLERVQMHAHLVAAAYNLIRIARLAPAPA